MISFDNSFFFDKGGLDFNNNSNYQKNLKKSIKASEKLFYDFSNGKNEILNSFTKDYQSKIRKLSKKIDYRNKKKVVIGFGGSSSGAKALSFFLNDEIIYFDNLDYQYLKSFFENKNIKDYFFFIISKSGDTFETLAVLDILIEKSKKEDGYNIFETMVIITENKKSILRDFAVKNKVKYLEHNPKIGGRFSILSETGMLPFLDIELKVENSSEKFLNLLKNNKDNDLSPIKNVSIILTCLEKYKLNIYCNLLYNYRLKHFSYWFHQLHAESLGKEGMGLTPITSICPKDHHSMMQLYLDGPKDKFFNIFSPPDEKYFDNFDVKEFYNIQNYTPQTLLIRQFKSVIEVFRKKKLPHRVISLQDHKDPSNIIELFSYFLLETILLGELIKVDPYGQPAVQLIKDNIFKD